MTLEFPQRRRLTVSVIGATDVDEPVVALARELGREIAERGWNLACGGGEGVMEAVCRGFSESAAESKGVTIGILPSDEADWANAYVDVAVPTGLGWARNTVLVRMADAVVSVAGGSGTLSELAFAWQMNKPIVALSESGGWSAELAGRALDNRLRPPVFAAGSLNEALTQLDELLVD